MFWVYTINMKDAVISARNLVAATIYKRVLKPIYFRQDPEIVHDGISKLGEKLGSNAVGRGLTRLAFGYRNPVLEQRILGIDFANPIGLSAGFDKNARLVDFIPAVGFGFMEIGSVTGKPCDGNPKPRLWRLPLSQALVVNYGLMNDGAVAVARRLRGRKFMAPVGISVAKTNSQATAETGAGVDDYVLGYRATRDVGAYVTINISCPNAYGGQPFTDKDRLERLLTAIDREDHPKPVFIKFSPDVRGRDLDALLDVALSHNVQGFVCSNLTKPRDNPLIADRDVPAEGGISGKVAGDLSDEQIRWVYARVGKTRIIVGCGGVFTAEDAYRKILSGSSLIQLITGMIYLGPQTISEINIGLVRLLKRDGFSSISEAVGAGESGQKETDRTRSVPR